MRVLLLNPPFPGLVGQGGKSAPLNLAYIASYLRQQKPKTKINILDCENANLDMGDIRYFLFFKKPDIVGITMPTPAVKEVLDNLRAIKEQYPEIITVVGGPHPTAFPIKVSEYPDIDLAVYGEGEVTFVNIVERVENCNPLTGINGTAHRGILNPPQPLIENLDTIPFPARDLLPMDKYIAPPTKRESNYLNANIIGSRGCPYTCTFCMNRIIWNKKVRFRSIPNIIDEIEECINKYNRREFNFHDELFTANRERTFEFCREIEKRKLEIVWVCTIRVDHIWEDVLRAMKKSGCRKIMFGFESGCQRILDNIKKKTTLQQVVEAVRLTKKVGIKSSGSFMIGNIGETPKTIQDTINFAKKLNVDTATFYVASPYPGTEFYDQSVKNGYFRDNMSWRDLAPISNTLPPLNLPDLSADEITYWQKRAYKEYYMRPKFLIQRLCNIRRIADIKNMVEGLKIFNNVIKEKK